MLGKRCLTDRMVDGYSELSQRAAQPLRSVFCAHSGTQQKPQSELTAAGKKTPQIEVSDGRELEALAGHETHTVVTLCERIPAKQYC